MIILHYYTAVVDIRLISLLMGNNHQMSVLLDEQFDFFVSFAVVAFASVEINSDPLTARMCIWITCKSNVRGIVDTSKSCNAWSVFVSN